MCALLKFDVQRTFNAYLHAAVAKGFKELKKALLKSCFFAALCVLISDFICFGMFMLSAQILITTITYRVLPHGFRIYAIYC